MFIGSHGQRHVLAVGSSLPTTWDHRRLRGDGGYHNRDIKGVQPLASSFQSRNSRGHLAQFLRALQRFGSPRPSGARG